MWRRQTNINRKLFPRFLFTVPNGERTGQEVLFRPTIRDYMIDETVGFIGELIRRNAPVLNIVDSDFAWLNEPLAAHYGVDGSTKDYPIQIAGGERLGFKHGHLHNFEGKSKKPLSNLFVSMLNAVDARVEKFAYSTGELTEILA